MTTAIRPWETLVIDYYQQSQFQPFALEHPGADEGRLGAMLMHGFTGSPAEMRPLAQLLSDQGVNCHVPSHPGMAGDIANLATTTARMWREHALEQWSEHTSRYDRTLLIGYSMGGAAAVQMAAHVAPDLLILISPFFRINDRRAFILPLARHMIREFRLLGSLDFDDPHVREWFMAALPDLDLDDPETRRVVREESGIASPVIDELRKFGALGRRDATNVTAPVVVIQGHHDSVVNPRHTRESLDRFQRLQAYHEIPADHLITLDVRPSWPAVRDLVLDEASELTKVAARA
ncbi:MAG: alpha/beta fold hydrolase [Chloroflexia bacterium]|nr:alpha/beta fold hydrolase [Chloroflexia bacterium]